MFSERLEFLVEGDAAAPQQLCKALQSKVSSSRTSMPRQACVCCPAALQSLHALAEGEAAPAS